MICRSDDPLADFDREDREAAEDLKHFPICAECGERITDEYAYRLGGRLYHQDCIEMVLVDDYLE